VTIRQVVFLCCLLALLSSTFAGPTTGPVVTERLTAHDVPLSTDGASRQQREWLKAYKVGPHDFTYTTRMIEEGDDVDVYRLVFPSPFKSPFPENNVVPAELYLPKERSGKIRAAIVLDILHGNAIVARGLSRGLASGGVAALYVPMAYYNARRPKDRAHERYLDADPKRVADPARQTVMDIRRAKAILAQRPEIDPDHIGITGVSLGGIITALAAGVDGTFDRVCPILAGGDVASLTFHTRETRVAKERLLARGIDLLKLEDLLAPVEPTHFAARLDPTRCLMINARNDEVIPKESTELLWKSIGKPTILWVPSGHYSAGLFLPTIRRTAVDFLKGNSVQRMEY
jgi:dienelactone hydrolase